MIKKNCVFCSKEFLAVPRLQEEKKYCSAFCYHEAQRTPEYRKKWKTLRSGENNPAWKGGRLVTKQGYVRVYDPITKKRKMEHQIVMEKVLGRSLGKNEIVHHKNGIKGDNRPENLEVMFRKTHYGKAQCPYCSKEFFIK